MYKILFTLAGLLLVINIFAQEDTLEPSFAKPKPFSFITHVPGEIIQMAKLPFQQRQIKTTAILAGTTTLLIVLDQKIYDGVRHIANQLNIDPAEQNKIIWSVKTGNKETVLLKAPKNFNTAFYMMGEGMPTLLIAGGLWLEGKINKDNRSLQTASDLSESFISLGLTTQLMKWVSGRENPVVATQTNGAWKPFVPIRDFQNNKPKYDAFPSGHLATMMATITILANNYPQKKWIRPVGYSLMSLTGLAMINNGVHWAGDYPVGIALGYLSGKIITARHKKAVKAQILLTN